MFTWCVVFWFLNIENRQTPFNYVHIWDTRLTQSVEHETLEIGIMSSSPLVGVEITLKKKKKT